MTDDPSNAGDADPSSSARDTEDAAPALGAIDWHAVIAGTLVGGAIALPAGLLGRVAPEGSVFGLLATLVVVVGLATGGYTAAKRRPDMAMAHGALAGLLAYLGVQGIGVVTTLARGEELRPLGYPLLAAISTSCGILGGWVATRDRRRNLEG